MLPSHVFYAWSRIDFDTFLEMLLEHLDSTLNTDAMFMSDIQCTYDNMSRWFQFENKLQTLMDEELLSNFTLLAHYIVHTGGRFVS